MFLRFEMGCEIKMERMEKFVGGRLYMDSFGWELGSATLGWLCCVKYVSCGFE
jgi:hypothetical protein